MNVPPIDLMQGTFVGIDAHPAEHTAVVINRFEEEKGLLQFENTHDGIAHFVQWLSTLDKRTDNIIIGIEGGGGSRRALLVRILARYSHLYEVNPLYTKQRRSFGTRPDKSDPADAKAIAGVLTRRLSELPKITERNLSPTMVCMKKLVWIYEDVTCQGTGMQNQLHQLKREQTLAQSQQERSVLSFIMKEREQALSQIQKTQRRCQKELRQLLTFNGDNLTSMKGISTILAAKLVAHSGGIERFTKLDGFIRYAGIAPRNRSSGKTKRHTRNTAGNRRLHGTLYLAAMIQIQWNPKAKMYYEKKIAEGKTKKQALTCVMKRTACIVYGMLKSGQQYRA